MSQCVIAQPQTPSVDSMVVFSLSSDWSNNITFFVTWPWVNLPLVVITFIQHLSDHCLIVSFKGCLTHQNDLFSFHPVAIFSSSTRFTSVWCYWTSRIFCPTLFHDDLLYLSCPSSSNNLSVSWFDRPHFTCCLIGFPSQIGMKNNLISWSLTIHWFLFWSKFQWMFSTHITPLSPYFLVTWKFTN